MRLAFLLSKSPLATTHGPRSGPQGRQLFADLPQQGGPSPSLSHLAPPPPPTPSAPCGTQQASEGEAGQWKEVGRGRREPQNAKAGRRAWIRALRRNGFLITSQPELPGPTLKIELPPALPAALHYPLPSAPSSLPAPPPLKALLGETKRQMQEAPR